MGIALGLALGFLLCGTIFSVYLDLPSQAPTGRDGHADSHSHSERSGSGSDLNETKTAPFPVQIVRSQDDKDKEREEAKNAREHAEVEHGLLNATWWLVGVTGALAVFTALLYASTQSIATDTRESGDRQAKLMARSISVANETASAANAQARLTQEAVALARDEFNATHRPRVKIHSVIFTQHGKDSIDDEVIAAAVWYASHGEQSAVIHDIVYHFGQHQLPLESGIEMDQRAKTPGTPITGGMRGWFGVSAEEVGSDRPNNSRR